MNALIYNAEMEAPRLKCVDTGEVRIAAWEWPGEEPALVFSHATGFHGRVWDAVARRFSGRRRVAIDHRGHGRSGKPAPPYRWDAFGRDLRDVVEALSLGGAIAIGHSMGGHSAAAAHDVFSALLLIDPTIFTRELYGSPFADMSFVRRRRNRWKSPDEMFESFRERPPFASWQPEVLRDYCEFGLLEEGDAFVLACPPEFEASIYEHSRHPSSNIYEQFPATTQPVTVMRSARPMKEGVVDMTASPTAPDLASRFPDARDVWVRDSDHFIPMTRPDLVAEEITALISRRRGSNAAPARP